jgi:hypothetical protein
VPLIIEVGLQVQSPFIALHPEREKCYTQEKGDQTYCTLLWLNERSRLKQLEVKDSMSIRRSISTTKSDHAILHPVPSGMQADSQPQRPDVQAQERQEDSEQHAQHHEDSSETWLTKV